MSDKPCVIVGGGGPAGLASTALLAQEGIAVTLIGPPAAEDLRTIALMQPSINLLRYLGVWTPAFEQLCAPLKQLHIIDDTTNYVQAPDLRFDASEIDAAEFGWNVPLTFLVPALRQRAAELGATFVAGKIAGAKSSGNCIAVTLDDGGTHEATLAIAADGANSVLRRDAGIGLETWSYDQSALIAQLQHSGSHGFISTEYHKPYGVFTTVPMPGNHSSLVWLDRPERIASLAGLSNKNFATEVQLELHGKLGLISNVTGRRTFAMRGARATTFAANRTFLVGETAHVMPPIGAQGLNMSLRDAGFVADVIIGSANPAGDKTYGEYTRLRLGDVTTRQLAVGVVNHTLLTELAIGDLSRAAAFAAIRLLPPLRAMIVQQGLKPSDHLPFAMRAG